MMRTSLHGGSELKLVFSDEFTNDRRTFYPSGDLFWEAPLLQELHGYASIRGHETGIEGGYICPFSSLVANVALLGRPHLRV